VRRPMRTLIAHGCCRISRRCGIHGRRPGASRPVGLTQRVTERRCAKDRAPRSDLNPTNGCCRRILPVPVGAGERPFTEPTAAARPWRREPLTLRANARHRARIGILGGEHAQPRAARAVRVEEPELAVGPLALAGRGDRIGRIGAGDHSQGTSASSSPLPGNKPSRLHS
jgi:hypothetical protein